MDKEKEKDYIDQLIASFLSGELNELQTGELKSWISQSEENEKYFMQYQEIWASSYSEEEKYIYDYNKAYERFRNRVSDHKNKSGRSFYIT